jgi:hypothetical protein
MAWLLPEGLRGPYIRIETFGMIVIFLLISTPIFGLYLRSTMELMYDAVRQMVTLGGLW